MNIEKLAFKDRRKLANLNEIDLLDIIEFLQVDRQQWINQFSKTHNESIEIQKQNKFLIERENKLQVIEIKQKEFIRYLSDMLDDENDIFSVVRVKDILKRYKEIIGEK